MCTTGISILVSLVCLLWCVGVAAGSEVLWTRADDLAPAGPDDAIASGDLDGDGDDDVAAIGYGNVHWNTGCPGPPAWNPEEDVLLPLGDCMENSIALGDCDADGDLDIIHGCYECCSLRMIWNTGDPHEPAWQYGGAIAGDPSGGHYAYACLVDLDADGDLDIVGTNASGAISFYENTGTPETPYWIWSEVIPGIGFGPAQGVMALGDLDGDGDLDIVGGTTSLICWENTGTAQAWSYVRNDGMLSGVTEPTDHLYGVALPDVDCDGDCDLLLVGWGAVYLYLNERITPVRSAAWGFIKQVFR
ncbi:MAG: VCBS repeat-containing protein [Candidatus Eisenbacteria bacterium]|nr:VCBS repeat-containing protein [Candidatus Eisenbacteria bacterium]